jgi:hypothetical protein
MGKINVAAVLTKIAGLSVLVSDVTFAQALTGLLGPNATKVISGIGLASVIAGELLHILDGLPSALPTSPPAPPQA